MKTLKQYIFEARDKKVAIGHFNISNSEGFHAVVNGAKALGVPVIIGVSEGERDFIGVNEISAMIRAYRQNTQQPVFLNADHTYSFERVKEAVDAGYDAVIYDGTELSLEDNIATTLKCAEYVREFNKNNDTDVLLEAEIGFIGKSSKLLDKVPDGVGRLTTVEEANEFIKATGVDMLAPAVGNVHGMVAGGEPALSIDRIREISEALGLPLVLHGASGNSEEDVVNAINAGINIIHINTELRVAYRDGLRKTMLENKDEIAPYKYLRVPRDAMQEVVEKKLRLFNKIVV